MDIAGKLSAELGIERSRADSAVRLIEEGNTIPFIARYRKEATGGLDDSTLRRLDERLGYLKNLQERKEEVLALIDEQGKLTDELRLEIEDADVLQRVEDLYKPFRKKRKTRASKAREKGLEPLALFIWEQTDAGKTPRDEALGYIDPENGISTADDALGGACDIIAEMISDDPDLTAKVRELTMKSGVIRTEAADPEEKTVYEMYYGREEKAEKIPDHRILAINRGEREKKLKVRIDADADRIKESICRKVIKRKSPAPFAELLESAVGDAYSRLMAPSAERDIRSALTERAEEAAVRVFAENTEKLLMGSPVKNARIISIDPGYRTGCKVAVIDETGKLLAHTVVFPTAPKNDVKGTKRILDGLCGKYSINTIVIGNGTASRETEEVVADFISESGRDIRYTIVNEAGASVYSASKLAAEEYPDLDVTVRGAISLGRRLQDPLAELVKIPTESIGVGQYQHDIGKNRLKAALDNVVEDCVNRVGVDLNTASAPLLSHIAGISAAVAKGIVGYREENGVFSERKELMKVPGLGEKTYRQCAGFMRISGGSEPLDATSVHPESYAAASEMLGKLHIMKDEIAGGVADIEDRVIREYGKGNSLSDAVGRMADDLGIGRLTLSDIVDEIKKPGRDPREGAPAVIFRKDVRSFDDLEPGMELEGIVRNVVDFGAFVDIGVKNDGLVHISEMSRKYVKHPLDVVSVGDSVRVRIISLDRERQKIALTMKL